MVGDSPRSLSVRGLLRSLLVCLLALGGAGILWSSKHSLLPARRSSFALLYTGDVGASVTPDSG